MIDAAYFFIHLWQMEARLLKCTVSFQLRHVDLIQTALPYFYKKFR